MFYLLGYIVGFVVTLWGLAIFNTGPDESSDAVVFCLFWPIVLPIILVKKGAKLIIETIKE